MDRISKNNLVLGFVVVNQEGFPEYTTLDSLTSAKYASHMKKLAAAADKLTTEIDPMNEVVVVRMGTRTTEVLVAPDPEAEFNIVVVMKCDRERPRL